MARLRKELPSPRKVVLNGRAAEAGRGARNLWAGIRMAHGGRGPERPGLVGCLLRPQVKRISK